MFISSKIGPIFFNNSVSSQNTIAYGSILSKYNGYCCKNNLNLFSSHVCKNSLYHKICDLSLNHSSLSLSLLLHINAQIIIDTKNKIIQLIKVVSLILISMNDKITDIRIIHHQPLDFSI